MGRDTNFANQCEWHPDGRVRPNGEGIPNNERQARGKKTTEPAVLVGENLCNSRLALNGYGLSAIPRLWVAPEAVPIGIGYDLKVFLPFQVLHMSVKETDDGTDGVSF